MNEQKLSKKQELIANIIGYSFIFLISLIALYSFGLMPESITSEVQNITKSSKESMQENIKTQLNQQYENTVKDVTLVKVTDHLYDGIVTLNDESTLSIEVTVDEDNYIWKLKP